MSNYAYCDYMKYDGEEFFTLVALPAKDGKFPTVVLRSPYVTDNPDETTADIAARFAESKKAWCDRGYAFVTQHCRGRGKSSGAFMPYIIEREDSRALLQWVREQSFYNGEIFLDGASYSASLFYETAPFDSDVKGAIFEVQDSERYRLWYRGGQMRKGHAKWQFWLYKEKCGLNKNYSLDSFARLPIKGLSEAALGERAEDFEQMLEAQDRSHPFWNTRFGGCYTKGALNNADIPILLATGYNDFYVGGVFKMWEEMESKTKEQSAFIVSPYNHGDGYDPEKSLYFPNGKRAEGFGKYHKIDWCDHILRGTALPFSKGKITYYRAFENKWDCISDFYNTNTLELSLGDGTSSFEYDPLKPTSFTGEGLFANDDNASGAVITLHTKPFDKDVFVRGRMKAVLAVESDCPDTSFFVRISIKNEKYTYVLRHDITSMCYQLGDYTPGSVVNLEFNFDDYAFLLKKGEVLQIDIAGTDNNTYVSHTNKKGPYYLQTDTAVANNKVYLDKSRLILPIE